MHVINFVMFWKSLLLFCHIFICLKILFQSREGILPLISHVVWKIWLSLNICLVFLIAQLTLPFLFKLFCLCFPLILTFLLRFFLVFRWRELFYFQLEFFLNTLIAQIRVGQSFRSAFKLAVLSLPKKEFQNYFEDIREQILFAKNPKNPFPERDQVIGELKRADQSSHCLQNLENLRHQIRVQALFRKKVRSALLQIHVQSLVLLILYVGLFLFVLQKYGWKYMSVLLFSLFLFLLGLIVLFQCGRRMKWTV